MMNEPTVIALGFFDGVHLGHGALLHATAERAAALGAVPAAFTFDRSPREFVTGTNVPLLSTAEERAERMRTLYGVNTLFVEPFDRTMMTLPWQDFVTELLVKKYHAVHLVAGHDYRFGHRNEGDPQRLLALCEQLGLGCDIVPRVTQNGVTVSSTHIRALLEAGDVETARAFLGYPYALCGEVCHGRGIGHARLLPTANLAPDARRLLPARGVYVTRAVLPEGSFPAVTNVGLCPTVRSDGGESVETYLLEGGADLYGKPLRVEFYCRLRGEQQFESTAALHERIAVDAERARCYWAQHPCGE